MPEIALELIRPNPFRDFELHPIDEMQVMRLLASIQSNGFWSSVVARPAGDSYELAFGHHRIEAARRKKGMDAVPIEVRDLSDAQMAVMLASENATQRGTTAAASLDAVAALSRAVTESSLRCETPELMCQIWPISQPAAERIWGNIRNGGQPGRDCIQALLPADTFTHHQIDLALHVLRDSGRLGDIEEITFDAKCAKLFRRDYHLQEFRRIVTGDVVRSYLPVSQQFDFAQKIIAAVGGELTAIKLRERANVIFYEELGMPRHAMRNSPLRMSDDRVKDAMNLMRRGTHSVKQCCRMLATLMAEGVDVAPEVIDRFKDYIAEIDQALKSLTPPRSAKRSNLRLIISREEDVA